MTNPEQIHAWRTTLGVSMKTLGELANVDRTTIARIEAGEGDVRASTIARLVQVLTNLSKEVDLDPSRFGASSAPALEVVIFNALADHTSDPDWLDDMGAKLAKALRESGLLRDGI